MCVRYVMKNVYQYQRKNEVEELMERLEEVDVHFVQDCIGDYVIQILLLNILMKGIGRITVPWIKAVSWQQSVIC